MTQKETQQIKYSLILWNLDKTVWFDLNNGVESVFRLSLFKNDGLMKMSRLTLLCSVSMFLHVLLWRKLWMADGDLAATQIENRLLILISNTRFHDTE